MIGAYIQAAGAVLNIASTIYGANMAKKDLRRQAMALEDQARLVEEQAQFQSIQTAKQFESLLGEQKFSVAISGAEMEGSLLNIFDKTIADKEENIAIIKRNAEIEANLLRQQTQQVRKKRKRLLPMAIVSGLGNIAQSASNFRNIGNKTMTQ
jgi:hypothetical protein